MLPDVVHTSVLRRAITTAHLALDACDRHWIPVRRSWRLNERHYGALQGKDKKATLEEYGEEQFMLWRRSYDTPPPPHRRRRRVVAGRGRPRTPTSATRSCLAPSASRTSSQRMLPYWYDAIVPDLAAGGPSRRSARQQLRALVKHLDEHSPRRTSSGSTSPPGMPLVYRLDEHLRPTSRGGEYLDPEAAAAAPPPSRTRAVGACRRRCRGSGRLDRCSPGSVRHPASLVAGR